MNEPVFFYEKDFYMFSNFSSFTVEWRGNLWMTAEHAYQAAKFEDLSIVKAILEARSAHDAKRIAHANKGVMSSSFAEKKIEIMKSILQAKATQHLYVREVLLSTESREIIEDSPKDSFWGWGPNKDGQNRLGKLWMEVREEVRNGEIK